MKLINILSFWQRPISLQFFIFLFSCWVVFPLNIGFLLRLYQFVPYSGFAVWLFMMAMMLLLIAYFYFIFNLLMWRCTAKVLFTILLIVTGWTSYLNYNLGASIDAFQIQNLLQTDPKETLDLLNLKWMLWTVALMFIPSVIFLNLRIKKQSIRKTLGHKLIALTCSFAVILALVFIYYVDLAAIFRENRQLKGYLSPQNVISSSWSYYKKLSPKKNLPLEQYGQDAKIMNSNSQQLPKLMVFVVGETARAESFSLNSYARNTNPQLSQLPIINFSQVTSCGTSTAISVPCMFSGMSRQDYDARLAVNRENALDILKRSGYQVTWMENNSGCKEVCNRVEQYKFSEKLKQKWCKDDECYDEILVDGLKEYLTNIPQDDQQPRAIFLHQMGSHGPAYYKRSPETYRHFKPFCNTNAIQGCSRQELINVYDNSIVYTDAVLGQLIQLLQQQQRYQSAFWYISDHGESTGEKGLYLHGAPYVFAPSQQTHVPMLMWFSSQWRQSASQQLLCLSQQKDQLLSQDNIFSTLLTLLNVETEVKQPGLDLLQRCEKP